MKDRLKGKSLIGFPSDCVVLDIETTGFNPDFDEIIELAAVRYSNRAEIGRFESLVRPENKIDPYISSLTGITNEMASDAPSISEILPSFIDFIGDSVIVGHNVGFDINFLYDNSERIGYAPVLNDYIDTMRLSRRLCPSLEHHTLDALGEHLGVRPQDRHRAMGDCLTAWDCFEALRALAEEMGGIPEPTYAHHKVNANDITAETLEFDPDSPVFGKVFAFTGALESGTRAEAMQLVANAGGINGNGVTRETNYLVLGNTDYCAALRGGKSAKHKKAETLALKGQDIRIISESTFLDMLSGGCE